MNKYIVAALVAGLVAFAPAQAQTAAELIEKARAESREIEELKAIMDGPDRNLRLAAFDAMMASDKPLFRSIATEAGLASTDSLLRAHALRAVIFNMSSLMVSLTVDPEAPKELKEASEKYLATRVPALALSFHEKAPDTGTIDLRLGSSSNSGAAEVQGLNFIFTQHAYGSARGTLSLVDDTTLRGPISIDQARFIGTAKLR